MASVVLQMRRHAAPDRSDEKNLAIISASNDEAIAAGATAVTAQASTAAVAAYAIETLATEPSVDQSRFRRHAKLDSLLEFAESRGVRKLIPWLSSEALREFGVVFREV